MPLKRSGTSKPARRREPLTGLVAPTVSCRCGRSHRHTRLDAAVIAVLRVTYPETQRVGTYQCQQCRDVVELRVEHFVRED